MAVGNRYGKEIGMFGLVLSIALLGAALLYMVGITDLAKRIIVTVLLLAFFAPCLMQLLRAAGREVDGRLVGVIALVVFVALAIAGWIRFVNHRRALHRWWREPPSSLKQRLEDDL
jgi:amino acid permease